MNYQRFELAPITTQEKAESTLDPRIAGSVGKRIIDATSQERKLLKPEHNEVAPDHAQHLNELFQEDLFEKIWQQEGSIELGQLVANCLTLSQVALNTNDPETSEQTKYGIPEVHNFLAENAQASPERRQQILIESLISSAKRQLNMPVEFTERETNDEKTRIIDFLADRLVDNGACYCACNSIDRNYLVTDSQYTKSQILQTVDNIEETLDIFDKYQEMTDERYYDRYTYGESLEYSSSPNNIYNDALSSPAWLNAIISQKQIGTYNALAKRDYNQAKSQVKRFTDASFYTEYGSEEDDEVIDITEMSDHEKNLVMQTFEKAWEYYAPGKPEVAIIPNTPSHIDKIKSILQERLENTEQDEISLYDQVQILLEALDDPECQNLLIDRDIGADTKVEFVSLPSFQPRIEQYQTGETIASVDPVKLREVIYSNPTKLEILSSQGKKLQYVEGIDETDLRFLQLEQEVQRELNYCYQFTTQARSYLKSENEEEYRGAIDSAQGFYLYRKKFFHILDQIGDFKSTDHYDLDEKMDFRLSDRLHLAIASKLALEDHPDQIIDRIGNIMRSNHLPDIAKEYLVFTTLNPPEKMIQEIGSSSTREIYFGRNLFGDNYSRAMIDINKKQGVDGIRKMFYTDLLKCTFGSNGQEIEQYLNQLETRDALAQKVISGEQNFLALPFEERLELSDFATELNSLWQQTHNGANQPAEKLDYLNMGEHLANLYDKFKPNQRYSLPDRIIRSFTWPLGIRGVDDARAYLERTRLDADLRNRKLAKQIQTDGGIHQIHKGDFVKAVQQTSYLPNILQNGILCHEMLGNGAKMDATPFDTDFSEVINDAVLRTGLTYTNAAKYTSLRGQHGTTGFFIVIDRPLIDDELQWSNEYDYDEDGEWIYRDAEYDKNRFEIFRRDEFVEEEDADFLGLGERWQIPKEKIPDVSIRTGVPSNHISYLVIDPDNFTMKYEVTRAIKKSSFYIPVVDYLGKLLLTPEEYDAARETDQ